AGGPVSRLREVTRRAGAAWDADIVVVHNPEIRPVPGVIAVGLPSAIAWIPPWPRRLLEPWLLRRAVGRLAVSAVIHYGSYVPMRRVAGVRNVLFLVNLAPWDPGEGSRTLRNRILRLLFHATLPQADLVVVQSAATEAFVLQRYPQLAGRIAAVRNGCSVPELTRPAAPRGFLAVGHVYQYRRLDEVVRAYAQLPAAVRERHGLTVIGHLGRDAGAVRSLRQEIERLQLTDTVALVGPLTRDEVMERLINARAFVSFSAIDNGPNAVQEAAALGVSMVLSDIPVHRELADGLARYATTVSELSEAMLAAAETSGTPRSPSVRPTVQTWQQHVDELGALLRGVHALP
ncbi:MAG: glycosyltransferase, partial [Longimicrobiales bacterium]